VTGGWRRYGVFFPTGPATGVGLRIDVNAEVATGVLALFFSDFGFFFSRLLLCSRFAMASSSETAYQK
jgi:hypothetical protein